MNILQFEYRGLRKIISGGQCGSDRGGLEAAKAHGLPTGGYAPKGWRTQNGPAPELAEFGLIEHYSPSYHYRTEQNVVNSDGTLIVATNNNSPGTVLTRTICRKLDKPFYSLTPKLLQDEAAKEVKTIVEWMQRDCIEVLNVAGNRDSSGNPYHHRATYSVVTCVLDALDKLGMLNISKT